ncbi:hypothetical protein CY34DRAFT_17379 [Suillus luteus UH-Slu-Lm8-n1]|uniref:Uncharacterized protein n=1 Tax=Suillus luteus UH-Slu-Lm8-n1 TaxID=930992 RepID=A0A0D0A9Z2_9AGAM|nr:hypothetical protein CY34DRAFT_17379 [Suillus luteus UH-Slu-Lm8-n1]
MAITDDNVSRLSTAPVNGLAKMRAQMANRANAAKRPATPVPNPIPTPPHSSVTPDPLPTIHSPTPGPSVLPKSPAGSELTPSDDDLDDVSAITKGKKKMSNGRAQGKTMHRTIQESEDEDEAPAIPTKGRPRAKRVSHRRK